MAYRQKLIFQRDIPFSFVCKTKTENRIALKKTMQKKMLLIYLHFEIVLTSAIVLEPQTNCTN